MIRTASILLLRQQLLILHRRLSRKPAYGRLEKLALLLATLRLPKQRLASALLIRPTRHVAPLAPRARAATLDFPAEAPTQETSSD